jgi:hypothetical protein
MVELCFFKSCSVSPTETCFGSTETESPDTVTQVSGILVDQNLPVIFLWQGFMPRRKEI